MTDNLKARLFELSELVVMFENNKTEENAENIKKHVENTEIFNTPEFRSQNKLYHELAAYRKGITTNDLVLTISATVAAIIYCGISDGFFKPATVAICALGGIVFTYLLRAFTISAMNRHIFSSEFAGYFDALRFLDDRKFIVPNPIEVSPRS